MFIKTYFDENISVIVAEIIRSRGFAVVTAQEVGNKGLSDREQLEFASRNEMVILTHDRKDYEKLALDYFKEKKSHHGIIIVFPHYYPQEIVRRLINILNHVTADEMINQIVYI